MENCGICKLSFVKKSWNQKYCSYDCKQEAKKETKHCGNCKTEFRSAKKTSKYCSMLCASIGEGRRKKVCCGTCEKDFYIKKSKENHNYGKFCSKECANKSFERYYPLTCKHCNETKMFQTKDSLKKRKFCSDECKESYFNRDINHEEVIKLYKRGMSPFIISVELKTNDKHISKVLKNNNVLLHRKYNHQKIKCLDGHVVRSSLEQYFDDKLYEAGIEHEYEPKIKGRFKGDFKVDDIFIEIWGMHINEKYRERMEVKRELYKELGITLFEVYPEDFYFLDDKIKELKELRKIFN